MRVGSGRARETGARAGSSIPGLARRPAGASPVTAGTRPPNTKPAAVGPLVGGPGTEVPSRWGSGGLRIALVRLIHRCALTGQDRTCQEGRQRPDGEGGPPPGAAARLHARPADDVPTGESDGSDDGSRQHSGVPSPDQKVD